MFTDAPFIHIGERRVSPVHPCFIIAEIGVNHNGDMALAKKLVDAAADAGADAVKFQTFRTADLVVADAPKASYQSRQTGGGTQSGMLSGLELSTDQFRELRAYCRSKQIDFMSTAFDAASLAEVIALQPKVLKWPSGEIDNHPFLLLAASSGLPIILSTGMADLAEIGAAIAVAEAGGCKQLAILQCVSQYPAPLEEQNLLAISSMRAQFGRVTGFSDHTEGSLAAIAARGLGMAILEKHITLDRSMVGPDHAASMEPAEFTELVKALRGVEQALGNGEKRLMPSELDTRRVARKSLVYSRDMQAGHIMREHDITAKRPGGGMSPSALDRVVGRKLLHRAVADRQIEPDDLS